MRRARAFSAFSFCLLRAARGARRRSRTKFSPDPALEARAARHLRRIALPGLPEPVDRRFATPTLAKDLRILVREQLKAGDSDDAIRAYLVAALRRFHPAEAAVRMGDAAAVARTRAGSGAGGGGELMAARRKSIEAAAAPGGTLRSGETDGSPPSSTAADLELVADCPARRTGVGCRMRQAAAWRPSHALGDGCRC